MHTQDRVLHFAWGVKVCITHEFVIFHIKLNPWKERHRETQVSHKLSRVFFNFCLLDAKVPNKMCHMKKLPPPVGTLLFGTGTKQECASTLAFKKGKILIHQRSQLQGLILRHQVPYESWILFEVQSRAFQMNGYDWNEIGTCTCLLLQSLAFPSWTHEILK